MDVLAAVECVGLIAAIKEGNGVRSSTAINGVSIAVWHHVDVVLPRAEVNPVAARIEKHGIVPYRRVNDVVAGAVADVVSPAAAVQGIRSTVSVDDVPPRAASDSIAPSAANPKVTKSSGAMPEEDQVIPGTAPNYVVAAACLHHIRTGLGVNSVRPHSPCDAVSAGSANDDYKQHGSHSSGNGNGATNRHWLPPERYNG
jgi:hypothetical protein